jgi:hypothetical protein
MTPIPDDDDDDDDDEMIMMMHLYNHQLHQKVLNHLIYIYTMT